MASHPRKAVPGARRGRRRVLPVERAREVYALAAAGWTMRDMAAGLGVSLRALYLSQRRSGEIAEALAQGRAEYRRRREAAAAAAAAIEQRAARQAAQQVMALLSSMAPAPAPPPAPPPVATTAPQGAALPLDALSPTSSTSQGDRPAKPLNNPLHPLDTFNGEPLPMDDPLAAW